MSKNRTLHRSAVALCVAVGMLVFSAAGAGAAGIKPLPLRGIAHADALKITLTVPGTAELIENLKEAGIQLPIDIPDTVKNALPAITIEQIISTADATSLFDPETRVRTASGYAQPLKGTLLSLDAASTACSKAKCNERSDVSALSLTLLEEQLGKGGLGTIEVAGAHSKSTSSRDTLNNTSIASVNVGLQNLLKQVPQLDSVLDQLYEVINKTVVPTVNGAIDSVEDTLLSSPAGALYGDVQETLETFVETGDLKEIPDIRKVNLLELTVLPAYANVKRDAGLLKATSQSAIADLKVLGNWLTLDSVKSTSESFLDLNLESKTSALSATSSDIKKATGKLAKSVPADAIGSMNIGGLDFGGLLKMAVPEQALFNRTTLNRLQKTLRDNAPAGLEDAVEKVVNALDLAYTTAGISLEVVKGTTVKPDRTFSATSQTSRYSKGGTTFTSKEGAAALNIEASNVSDMLQLIVEPKIPVFGQLPDVGGIAGQLTTLKPQKYVSAGIKLQVDFPRAETAIAQGAKVLGFKIARTGVGINWLIVGMLAGAAVLVRRFALSR